MGVMISINHKYLKNKGNSVRSLNPKMDLDLPSLPTTEQNNEAKFLFSSKLILILVII